MQIRKLHRNLYISIYMYMFFFIYVKASANYNFGGFAYIKFAKTARFSVPFCSSPLGFVYINLLKGPTQKG